MSEIKPNDEVPKPLKDRVRTSRELGSDPSYVLHGGGNTSAKGVLSDFNGDNMDVIWVKGSGWDLATIEAAGLPALDLKRLRSLRKLEELFDNDMVDQVRRCMLEPSGPTPSIETLLHAFLPHRFIDHSHADAILAISNRPDGEAICRQLYGDRVFTLPWIMPGFPLAKAVADAFDAHPDAEGVLLHKHGLFTWGDTADESLELHRELVGIAAAHYAQERAVIESGHGRADQPVDELLPRLRGQLGSDPRFVLELRDDPWILAALDEPDAQATLCTMPLTPDH